MASNFDKTALDLDLLGDAARAIGGTFGDDVNALIQRVRDAEATVDKLRRKRDGFDARVPAMAGRISQLERVREAAVELIETYRHSQRGLEFDGDVEAEALHAALVTLGGGRRRSGIRASGKRRRRPGAVGDEGSARAEPERIELSNPKRPPFDPLGGPWIP